ncbi:hypothetical protein GCM10010176_103270 [Nonomuraea spiralis]|nr:hypothetical protein GCM10010176_103270 [Nonomuraea spiralis]
MHPILKLAAAGAASAALLLGTAAAAGAAPAVTRADCIAGGGYVSFDPIYGAVCSEGTYDGESITRG